MRRYIITFVLCALYLAAKSYFMGFSWGILLLTLGVWLLYNASAQVRRFVAAVFPLAIFGIVYDFLRVYPNYLVNPVDTIGLYEAEKDLFGFMASSVESLAGGTVAESVLMIPSEYFKLHHWAVADFFAGIFYLCWVPLPIAYGLYLYFTGRESWCLRFCGAFLFVNLVGFVGYYVHPAAPPWYVMDYGFEPDFSIGGQVAGFARFDEMLGVNVFHSMYGQNSNVFAAVPSLHSAYMLIPLYYACKVEKRNWMWIIVLAVFSVGIWFSAVYSGHHYIIDVMLGILCAVLGIALYELLIMRVPCVHKAIQTAF